MEKMGKSKKEARDDKAKEKGLEDVILKTLDECSTPEDKVQLLLRKQVDSEKKILSLAGDIKMQQRTLELQQREKELMQRELNKSVLMRDKLQEVCREQQKIIKSVKNESMLKIREEEERRKESQSKFQNSLNEISQSLTKNNEENLKLREYNNDMTKKLKYLAEQYQLREKQLEKLNEQVQLETQLHVAKLNKVQVEAAMEKEILTKENQIGLEKLLQAQRMIKDLSEREQSLKEQLNIYTGKYDEFQQSLHKSNEMFTRYKLELEKMSKNMKKVEKDALTWRQKYEKANAALIELATEKQVRDEHAVRCNKQVDQLQKLLRVLQLERANLHNLLREKNIEIPPTPLPDEPEPMKIEPINSDKHKMEIMSRNCAELKETLSNLQSQMKMLTTKEDTPKPPNEDATAANKKKNKKKNKKNKKIAAAATVADGNAADIDNVESNENENDQAQQDEQPVQNIDDTNHDNNEAESESSVSDEVATAAAVATPPQTVEEESQTELTSINVQNTNSPMPKATAPIASN